VEQDFITSEPGFISAFFVEFVLFSLQFSA